MSRSGATDECRVGRIGSERVRGSGVGNAQLSGPGPGLAPAILLLIAGWLPVLAAARLLRVRLQPGRLAMGAALSAFVGGMCCVELRRYGLLALPTGAITLWNNGLAVHDILRFGLMGAAGAAGCEILLSRIVSARSHPIDRVP